MDDNAGQILFSMDDDDLTGQYSGVQPADFGHPQKFVHDAGDHQSDGVHMGRQQQAGARFCGAAMFESMQAAQATDLDLVHKGTPGVFDELAHGHLVTR